MKWWAFNQEQLDAALTAWAIDSGAQGSAEILRVARDMEAIRQFLDSKAARTHKLRGDPQ